jgi:hypothetical protein
VELALKWCTEAADQGYEPTIERVGSPIWPNLSAEFVTIGKSRISPLFTKEEEFERLWKSLMPK